jgi:hypothetical protein
MKHSLSLSIILCTLFAITSISCSKDDAVKSPLLEHISALSSVKPGEDCTPYYTDDTVSAAKKYASKFSDTEILSGMDRKIFMKGSKYSIVSETRNGDDAEIVLKITKHPQPNMIGFEMRLKMKFEDSKWKIDRSREIENLLK